MRNVRITLVCIAVVAICVIVTLRVLTSSSGPGLISATDVTSDAPPTSERETRHLERESVSEVHSSRTVQEALSPSMPVVMPEEIEFHALVLDARSSTPISAVLLWGAQQVIADANGVLSAFQLAKECPERAELSAPGYEALVLESKRDGGNRWKLGAVLLSPTSTVSLYAELESGIPASGANITIAMGGKAGPLWRGWSAGETDSQGRIELHAKLGELILASHANSSSSARAMVGAKKSIKLILRRSGEHWIGLRDARTREPLANLAVDVVGGKGFPGLHWAGVSGRDGVLPVALPSQQVVLSTPGPIQFVLGEGLSTTIAIDLGELPTEETGVHWVELRRDGGRWLRFLRPDVEEPVENAIAETFRSVSLPDGQVSELRVGTQQLKGGLLNLEPYLDAGTESLYAIVTAPNLYPFDTRRGGVLPSPGETRSVPLRSLSSGTLQLVGSGESGSSGGATQYPAAGIPIWLFVQGFNIPVAILRSDGDGIVRNVPNMSQTAGLALTPSPSAVIAELMPVDLYRDPPLRIQIPAQSRITVTFEPSQTPHEEFELAFEKGGTLYPRVENRTAIFDHLVAGRYALGTSGQLNSTRWMRQFDSVGAFPLELRAGEDKTIRADPSWARRAIDPNVLTGTVLLDGPESAMVVALFQNQDETHVITAPRYFCGIDASGRYEIPASPDVLSLSAGTLDPETRTFVPLAVFPRSADTVSVTGSKLFVHAGKGLGELAILELKLHPKNFKASVSLTRGLAPGEPAADFGWIPMGKHTIKPLGGTATIISIEKPGVYELELGIDGTIVARD